jgi:serine phosphatase RsbU (regulator of sigma subunit)/predicted enzyme related to lactoylglutathione lyase
MTPMSSSSSSFWTERTTFRLNRSDPYLHLHFVIVFVRDQERSLCFYRDQLGFDVLVDHTFSSGTRWIEVAPPDGTAKLALVVPGPDSEEEKLIGRFSYIFFLTDDVHAKFEEWRQRGVSFQFAPEEPAWGGVFTRFEDVDGNSFGLAGFDEATRELEAQRRTLAQRAEMARRAAQELETAQQVQARLFPQTFPNCRTLEYAGLCLQARQVGGDYYDFLALGPERLGLLIGDISGKGMAAALLMANLQANLRSQYALALDQPQRFLRSANQLFYENTADSSYATLFYAEYEDVNQKLLYINCGHLAALLLRHDDSVERLESTATVLGLFPKWDCSAQSCQLFPGDVLILYTDGVTESFNERSEEFGEERLLEALRRYRNGSSQAMLASIVEEVRQFSQGEQHDDITVIVAKCQGAGHAPLPKLPSDVPKTGIGF